MDLNCRLIWPFAVICLALGGCGKPGSPVDQKEKTTKSALVDTSTRDVSRWHWVGKKHLAGDTNAAYLMNIWASPESQRLEKQTLDKLAFAPWLLLKGDAATNGAPIALLRSLLDDLVAEESYVEIGHSTNQPVQFVLALRLDDAHAKVWETNLAGALESLTGNRPAVSTGNRRGWSLKRSESPKLIEFTRIGDWIVLGVSQDSNGLFSQFAQRIERDHVPFSKPLTTQWVEASLNLRRLASVFSPGLALPENTPQVELTVSGDGQNVRTRAELNFPRDLSASLGPWNVPTNLISEPLTSFTAVRGFEQWLSSFKLWKDLQLGTPPDQAFFWGQRGIPMQTFFAAPMSNANSRIELLARTLLDTNRNSWLPRSPMTHFDKLSTEPGVIWDATPFLAYYLKPVTVPEGEFISGSFLTRTATNLPPPTELIQTVVGRTNLMYYDWEITGLRLESLVFLGQVLRLVHYKAQLPATSASMAWIMSGSTNFGNSVSVATRTAPNQISFVRGSSVGFTGVELHLLADWLESPRFPAGLHAFLAPTEATIRTNSPVPVPKK